MYTTHALHRQGEAYSPHVHQLTSHGQAFHHHPRRFRLPHRSKMQASLGLALPLLLIIILLLQPQAVEAERGFSKDSVAELDLLDG